MRSKFCYESASSRRAEVSHASLQKLKQKSRPNHTRVQGLAHDLLIIHNTCRSFMNLLAVFVYDFRLIGFDLGNISLPGTLIRQCHITQVTKPKGLWHKCIHATAINYELG